MKLRHYMDLLVATIINNGENMKYFVTSDIHGFFKPFKKALEDAGFEYNNQNHILVVCGDLFDRGDDALSVYNYIKGLPKERRILIKGNHDYLFVNLFNKDKPDEADILDGTYDSMRQLANDFSCSFEELKNKEIIKEVVRFFNSNEFRYFYEANKYIFVHSFIPLGIKETCKNLDDPNIDKDLYYDPDWRKFSDKTLLIKSAYDSSWRKFKAGYFEEEAKKGKVLICGHTHGYEFYRNIDGVKFEGKNYDFSIYYGDHLINLDGNVEKSEKINVLVLDID